MTDMCISAANYIINKVNMDYQGVTLSSKRLQKLLYFSNVLYMVKHPVKVFLFRKPMFNDDFYAWESGPVIPSVYDTFVIYQSGVMFPYDEKRHTLKNKRQQRVIDRILEITRSMSTAELIKESHAENGPWARVYNKNNPDHDDLISNRSVWWYYRKQEKLLGKPLKDIKA